jgi:ribosome biogenesis protein MAK21
VSLYTRHLLAEGALPPNATPDLGQNTLASFLDRFVYRNPKKRAGAAGEEDMAADAAGSRGKGGSLMQPAASAVEGVKLMKGEQLERRVNDETWWKRRVEDIGVDQVSGIFSLRVAQRLVSFTLRS